MADIIDQMAEQFLQAEGEQVVRDMAGHVGDQIFDVLRRNGMVMSTAAGSTGVTILAAVAVLTQADDFLRRSLEGECEEEATAAVAKLFMSELPAPLVSALRGTI